jgi:hypothetical protein
MGPEHTPAQGGDEGLSIGQVHDLQQATNHKNKTQHNAHKIIFLLHINIPRI